jgi:hypothetical protein
MRSIVDRLTSLLDGVVSGEDRDAAAEHRMQLAAPYQAAAARVQRLTQFANRLKVHDAKLLALYGTFPHRARVAWTKDFGGTLNASLRRVGAPIEHMLRLIMPAIINRRGKDRLAVQVPAYLS